MVTWCSFVGLVEACSHCSLDPLQCYHAVMCAGDCMITVEVELARLAVTYHIPRDMKQSCYQLRLFIVYLNSCGTCEPLDGISVFF